MISTGTDASFLQASLPSILIAVLLFALVGCGSDSYVENHINITPEFTKTKKSLGLGVMMDVPYNFEEASTYAGYQASDKSASISVRTSSSTIEELKIKFTPELLAQRNQDLYELSTVSYGDNEDAFFSVIRDNDKGTIRYLLAIKKQSTTYLIKAFCYTAVYTYQDPVIRSALFSSYIGTPSDDSAMFKFAAIHPEGGMLLTRDGKHPTESEDEAVVRIEPRSFNSSFDINNFIEGELYRLTEAAQSSVGTIPLKNGTHHNGRSSGNGKVGYISIILDENKTGEAIFCSGNSKASFDDFSNFIKKNFLISTLQ